MEKNSKQYIRWPWLPGYCQVSFTQKSVSSTTTPDPPTLYLKRKGGLLQCVCAVKMTEKESIQFLKGWQRVGMANLDFGKGPLHTKCMHLENAGSEGCMLQGSYNYNVSYCYKNANKLCVNGNLTDKNMVYLCIGPTTTHPRVES